MFHGLSTSGFSQIASAPERKREAHVRVVQVVGRADGDVVDRLAAAAQLVDVAVEALELDEEADVGKVAVQDADRVGGVERGNQVAAGLLDGAQVARRDVARRRRSARSSWRPGPCCGHVSHFRWCLAEGWQCARRRRNGHGAAAQFTY